MRSLAALATVFIVLSADGGRLLRINVDAIKMYYDFQEGNHKTRIEYIDQTVDTVLETPEEIDLLLQGEVSKK
jgi:hypothetical protein